MPLVTLRCVRRFPFLSRLILYTRAPNGAVSPFPSSSLGSTSPRRCTAYPFVYRPSSVRSSCTPSPLSAEPKQTGNNCLAAIASQIALSANGASARNVSSNASLALPISSRVSSSVSLPKSANTALPTAETPPSVLRISLSNAARSVSGRSILLTKIQVGTS